MSFMNLLNSWLEIVDIIKMLILIMFLPVDNVYNLLIILSKTHSNNIFETILYNEDNF